MAEPVLGFVGAGFVGGAMIRAFSGFNERVIYDKGLNIGSMEEVCERADVIFVALPTPMRKNGRCDTRIVEEVLKDIDELCGEFGKDGMEVVLRSTVPPPFLSRMTDELESTALIMMPEFLTERAADIDFITASRFILGVPYNSDGATTFHVFRARFPGTRIVITTPEEAAMIKYATNVFFTVKLSFLNELKQQCETVGKECDWETVRDELAQDGRIGRSHFKVPGPDGDVGWGGHCFPKDSRAYSAFCHDIGASAHMADAAWVVNEHIREDRNWESDPRATSED